MDGTEVPADSATTSLPEAGSTSSTPLAESRSADDPVVRLGERILAEIGDERTNSILTRWLAHHVAALIVNADKAVATGEPDAAKRAEDARAAILQLWDHRSAWPLGWPPSRAAEVVRLLDDLPALGEPLWYGRGLLSRLQDLHHHILAAMVDLATARDRPLERGWLDEFGDRLTADEAMLLTRAAGTNDRVNRLLEWSHAVAGEIDADSDHDQSGTRSDNPLCQLADTYRQTILDCLDRGVRAGIRGDEYGSDPVAGDAGALEDNSEDQIASPMVNGETPDQPTG